MIRGKYLRERKAMRIRRRVKFLVGITIILTIYRVLFDSYSLYESKATSDANIDIAFFVVNDMYQIADAGSTVYEDVRRIDIADLNPGDSKKYKISVANYAYLDENGYKTDVRTDKIVCSDVNIKYDLKIRTTTNLPLEYEIRRVLDRREIDRKISRDIEEKDSIYFRDIFETKEQKMPYGTEKLDEYELTITYPKEYNDAKYQGIIEYIEVSIDAEQIQNK